jgi:hypothetical protein
VLNIVLGDDDVADLVPDDEQAAAMSRLAIPRPATAK